MAGVTIAEAQAILDNRFPTSGGTDYVAYSVNGTSEWAGLTRTAVGATGWSAATAADPSVKANSASILSAAATLAATVTHTAIFSAVTAGTQRTDWQAVSASKTLAIGDKVEHAAGQLTVTLT